eukprot:scaffold260784_cov26-Tisochrysis_lutea.AAC.4
MPVVRCGCEALVRAEAISSTIVGATSASCVVVCSATSATSIGEEAAGASGGGPLRSSSGSGGGGGGGFVCLLLTPSSAIDSSMMEDVPSFPLSLSLAMVSCTAFCLASLGPALLMSFICLSPKSPPVP